MTSITQSLSKTCALVQVSFHRFNPVIQRRDLAEEYATSRGADRKSTKISVNLLDKTDAPSFTAINKLDGAIRNQVLYQWTTPTRVNGVRLTTNKALPMLREQLEHHEAERNALVRTFAYEEYPQAMRTAWERLGELYRARDFPSPEEVERAFRVSVRFTALSDAKTNIIGLPRDVLEMIETETKREHDDLRDLAFQQVVEKLHEQMAHTADKLDNYTVINKYDADKGRHVETRQNPFRDSLMLNLYDRIKQALMLDISVDSDLRPIAESLSDSLDKKMLDVNEQRQSERLRQKTVKIIRDHMKKMGDAGLIQRTVPEDIQDLYENDDILLM